MSNCQLNNLYQEIKIICHVLELFFFSIVIFKYQISHGGAWQNCELCFFNLFTSIWNVLGELRGALKWLPSSFHCFFTTSLCRTDEKSEKLSNEQGIWWAKFPKPDYRASTMWHLPAHRSVQPGCPICPTWAHQKCT